MTFVKIKKKTFTYKAANAVYFPPANVAERVRGGFINEITLNNIIFIYARIR